MLYKNLREKWAKVSAGYSLCRTVVFFLLVFLGWFLVLYTKNVQREKVILLPPKLTGKVVITDDSASPNYIKSMVDYVVYLATNYTPDTVNSRLKEFLKYVEPSVYEKVKSQIGQISRDVKFYGRTQAFYPKKFVLMKDKNEVIVEGRLVKFYMGKLMEDGPAKFVVGYRIRNGEFFVTEFYPVKSKSSGEKQ